MLEFARRERLKARLQAEREERSRLIDERKALDAKEQAEAEAKKKKEEEEEQKQQEAAAAAEQQQHEAAAAAEQQQQ